MPIDTTGISNENEFYTDHYLRAILEDDLKEIFSRWKDDFEESGKKPPDQLLRALPKDYFKTKADLEKLRHLSDVLAGQSEFVYSLLNALGYEIEPGLRFTETGAVIPILGEIAKSSGAPDLWILESVTPVTEPEDPLQQQLLPEQYPEADEMKILDKEYVEIITREIFGLSQPPRWILLLDFNSVVLIDRSKWNEKRLLRFDINEIFGRREPSTFRAMAALLHRNSICPDDGQALLDTLDDQSHKHAFQVSEDLKYSLREAIEVLGNEAIHYLRNILKEGIYGKEYSDQLTIECLRYMYRLLFLFYIEARPELDYADMKSKVYLSGYSLESLRDLELVPLTTQESRNGFFLDESVKMLFKLVYEGFDPRKLTLALEGKPQHHSFTLQPLKSHLFDPERTPLLNRVKFRNSVLQRVLELMSLSRPKGGRKNRRGRISYAQLGINQLGAVYEGLLSYRGFFAETDLYEVKRADQDRVNELDQAFFVKEDDLPKYKDEEKVFNTDEDQERNPAWRKGTLRKYPKGAFIYRLAGRDREKSASYYTPEVLTQCLVKYALKELLKDKTADEILNLTICEPAMGSAAFLNEAINQLADRYMQLKQKELDVTLAPDEYTSERQKVKMYIADRNVFGVDLNPIAVELAEVSLWLNSIHSGGFVPWFGMQLVTGNSLIGARRQMFNPELLRKKERGQKTWMDEVPKRYWPSDAGGNPPASEVETRKGRVYHFLVPDPGMANYKDKVIKELAPDHITRINAWRKEFLKPFTESQIRTLQKLSDTIDRLWDKHTEQLRELRKHTTDPIGIFGKPKSETNGEGTSTRAKDRKYEQELLSKNIRNSSLYRRLKLAMDYWCALWFWPIEKSALLPTRQQYLEDIQLIIEGELVDNFVDENGQIPLFPDTVPKQEMLALTDEFGTIDLNKLSIELPRLRLASDLVATYRYHHWELEFADVFADRGGFDLTLGNPPWIKVEWSDAGVMGELDPLFILRKRSASALALMRENVLTEKGAASEYIREFEGLDATQLYVNSVCNYPWLMGTKSNLYKCFIPQASTFSTPCGIFGFLHPEGVYDDPKGGRLRCELYKRLRYHFQFQNSMFLFPDVAHREQFSINIYNGASRTVDFSTIANLFAASTVDGCFEKGVRKPVGGIKDDNNNWNVVGHPDRLVTIGMDELRLFQELYASSSNRPTEAPLPGIHSLQVLDILRKFAKAQTSLGGSAGPYFSTQMWNETNAQRDKIIKRDTTFVQKPRDWIFSGPHFYVGNPIYKTPRSICTEKGHYDVIDLEVIPDDYVPRTNYVPLLSETAYRSRMPKPDWDEDVAVSEDYRLIFRGRLPPANEHTLFCAVMPIGSGHIHSNLSVLFRQSTDLVDFGATSCALPFDFFIKVTGRTSLWESVLRNLPLLSNGLLRSRFLSLVCLTTAFSDLWERSFNSDFRNDTWTNTDSRLSRDFFEGLSARWDRRSGLRSDFERRQALIELDVVTSMELGITCDELCAAYRIQFPVLRQNELDTWYDKTGRIVFTCSKALPGVGLTRAEWEEVKEMKSGSIDKWIVDDIMPDYRLAHATIRLASGDIVDCPCPDYPEPIAGPVERLVTYVPPFDRQDREEDYRVAWKEFERRGV